MFVIELVMRLGGHLVFFITSSINNAIIAQLTFDVENRFESIIVKFLL